MLEALSLNTFELETDAIYSKYRTSSLSKLAIMITALAIPIILSIRRVVPTECVLLGCITLFVVTIELLIRNLFSLFEQTTPKTKEHMLQAMIQTDPITTCFSGPITEEFIFRGCLQGGLSVGFSYILPGTIISMTGVRTLLSKVLAMVIASTLFGIAHSQQNKAHGLITGAKSLMLEASVFHDYGLLASFFTHTLSNTLIQASIILRCELRRLLMQATSSIHEKPLTNQ